MAHIHMTGITKRFPGVLANNRVGFELRPGEVHALLGENGAGKSTLMHILSGMYKPDEGSIEVDGNQVTITSAAVARELGIGMVHQHFSLVKTMTVAENFLIGEAQRGLIDLAQVKQEIQSLAHRFHLPVHPDSYIWQLSVGEQQRVEILRLLHRGATVLILDEPTSVLTPQEATQLGRTLKQMTAEGKSVIFITHKLHEVMEIADRVTVLRQGRTIASLEISQTSERELALHMVGREIKPVKNTAPLPPGETVLELTNLRADNDRGLPALAGVNLTVRAGEIIGIAGVAGNGQRELAEVITGLRRPTGGTIHIGRRNTTFFTSDLLVHLGIGHIPEDRLGTGVVRTMRVSDNLVLRGYRTPPLSNGPFLNRTAIREFVDRLIARFNIVAANTGIHVGTLSGGNVQKVILAREITASRGLIIAAQPTQGLDISAIESVHQALLDVRTQGAAILLISEDLDELLSLSDRIAVMSGGRIMGVVYPRQASLEEIGLMMAGHA